MRSFVVGLRRAVERSSIPHPLQSAKGRAPRLVAGLDEEGLEKLGDGVVEGGVVHLWGDFGQGGQDELTVVHGGVGEGEGFCLQDFVAVEE